MVDRKYRAATRLEPDTSNPVTSTRSFGGVARNVAETLARLNVSTALVSIVGDDENGRELLRDLSRLGIATDHIALSPTEPTAEYVAVLQPDGSLAFGLADMAILDSFASDRLDAAWPALSKAAWVFADCNLPAPVLEALIERARSAAFKLAVDAVSRAKAKRLPARLSGVDLLFLNETEAQAYLGATEQSGRAASLLRERGAAAVLLTRGAEGVIVSQEAGDAVVPALATAVADVTGAGDAFIAGTLSELLDGAGLLDAARVGSAAAALTAASEESVRSDLSPDSVRRAMAQGAFRTRAET